VDLGFVLSEHVAQEKLPAVSGSSGKLKVVPEPAEAVKFDYCGKVFELADTDYCQTMNDYVAAKKLKRGKKMIDLSEILTDKQKRKLERQTIKEQEETLRKARRTIRKQRKAEKKANKLLAKQNRSLKLKQKGLSKQQRLQEKAANKAFEKRMQENRKRRKQLKERHAEEDKNWRAERAIVNKRKAELPDIKSWIAILVIIDDCTRKSIGIPLFATGARTTAAQVAEQLRMYIPEIMKFLISDHGVHFKADIIKKLADELDFIQVLTGPHRPQTNGIAERFVRTLKEWLYDKDWKNDAELEVLLEKFQSEYNDRPHQGKELKGLSPNEYELRLKRA